MGNLSNLLSIVDTRATYAITGSVIQEIVMALNVMYDEIEGSDIIVDDVLEITGNIDDVAMSLQSVVEDGEIEVDEPSDYDDSSILNAGGSFP